MGAGESFPTRTKIGIEGLTFEFEGTEEFVTARLKEYGDRIFDLIPDPLEQDDRKTSSMSLEMAKEKSSQKQGQKRSNNVSAKPKTPKISAQRFDIHGNESVPSLEEFLAEKNPGKSNAEKIVVIGYYIAEMLGQKNFQEGQIEYAYKMLKYKRPTHLHQIMINAKNEKDWFEQTEETGIWQLTRSGDIFVSDELPRDEL